MGKNSLFWKFNKKSCQVHSIHIWCISFNGPLITLLPISITLKGALQESRVVSFAEGNPLHFWLPLSTKLTCPITAQMAEKILQCTIINTKVNPSLCVSRAGPFWDTILLIDIHSSLIKGKKMGPSIKSSNLLIYHTIERKTLLLFLAICHNIQLPFAKLSFFSVSWVKGRLNNIVQLENYQELLWWIF